MPFPAADFGPICALVAAFSHLAPDDISSPAFCSSMIFAENRFPLFRIML